MGAALLASTFTGAITPSAYEERKPMTSPDGTSAHVSSVGAATPGWAASALAASNFAACSATHSGVAPSDATSDRSRAAYSLPLVVFSTTSAGSLSCERAERVVV